MTRNPTAFNTITRRSLLTRCTHVEDGFAGTCLLRSDVPLAAQVVDRLTHTICAARAANAIVSVLTRIETAVARRVPADAHAAHRTSTGCLIVTTLTEECTVRSVHAHAALNIALLILGAVTILSTTDATTCFRAYTPLPALGIVLATFTSQRLPVAK